MGRDEQDATGGPGWGCGLARESDGLGEELRRGFHVGEGMSVFSELADQLQDCGDVCCQTVRG